MAKNKFKGKPRTATGVQNSTSSAPGQLVSKPAKGDVDCHVNVPSANTKVTAAMQQPSEPVAAPVVQIPPAESTTETWADPIADNSSYGTADSDDPLSAVSTPPAAAPSAEPVLKDVPPAQEARLYVPEPTIETAANPSTSTAAPKSAAVNGVAAADVSLPVHPAMSPKEPAGLAAPSHHARVAQVALVPQATPAAPVAAAGAPKSAADASSVGPVPNSSSAPAPEAPAGAATGLTSVLSWLLAAYTYPVRKTLAYCCCFDIKFR
jgi:S-DNA-T family DNA segregation ATPase FtsK/SpoIIIE